jgi:hypothetical protein
MTVLLEHFQEKMQLEQPLTFVKIFTYGCKNFEHGEEK